MGRRRIIDGGRTSAHLGLQTLISPAQHLLTAVVASAMQDCDAVRIRLSRRKRMEEWDPVLTRGRQAWQWLTDPDRLSRITFTECCEGTGADYDVAIDAVYARWSEAVQEVLDKPIVQPPQKTGAKRGVDSDIQRKAVRTRRRDRSGDDRH